jgi:hypothetical protein
VEFKSKKDHDNANENAKMLLKKELAQEKLNTDLDEIDVKISEITNQINLRKTEIIGYDTIPET